MRRELEDLRAKVKSFEDLFSSKDPAYASLLLKRVFLLLQHDNHLLWKILQENLGREWFSKPFLHRNLNYKYHIDYEPLDAIVGDLAKIVIGNHPADATKIASAQDCLVLSYMAEAFHNQKNFFVKELVKKDQLEQKLLEWKEDFLHKRESVLGEGPIPSSRQGQVNSHKSNTLLENEGNQDQSQTREAYLQGTVRMLLTELANVRAEKLAVYANYEVLRGDFALLERFLQELADAGGVAKDGGGLLKMVGKIKKLDQATLIKNNFPKILAQGKTDLIARLALMVL